MSLRPLGEAFYRGALDGLRARLRDAEVDGVLVLDPHNVVYLTGFFHAANERPIGLYVPVAGEPTLFVPLLERENAEQGAGQDVVADVRTYEEFPGYEHPVLWMARSCGGRYLAVDALPAALHAEVKACVTYLELSDAVMQGRAVKAPEELSLIRAAARYADACLDHLYAHAGEIIRSGGTELELLRGGVGAANRLMATELGEAFAGTPCRVVGTVHAGARAALPHGQPGAKRPAAGETLVAGIGACVGGLHAESGVTFALGEMTDDQWRCLEAAGACNDAAVDALRVGVPCEAVNEVALNVLREAGLGEAIRHRIGHGMGVQGHEAPWLAPGDPTPVEIGMVFSNEPGIYRPGRDGYRTINTMIVTENGVEVPSTFQARHPVAERVISL